MTTILCAWVDDEIAVKLRCGNEDFARLLESLKDAIAPHERRYSPQERQWFILSTAESDLIEWLSEACVLFSARVEWQSQQGKSGKRKRKQRSQPLPLTGAHAALHLLPDAPPELVKAAYRTLAQLHHPDKGGDTEAMQKINEAYRRLA